MPLTGFALNTLVEHNEQPGVRRVAQGRCQKPAQQFGRALPRDGHQSAREGLVSIYVTLKPQSASPDTYLPQTHLKASFEHREWVQQKAHRDARRCAGKEVSLARERGQHRPVRVRRHARAHAREVR